MASGARRAYPACSVESNSNNSNSDDEDATLPEPELMPLKTIQTPTMKRISGLRLDTASASAPSAGTGTGTGTCNSIGPEATITALPTPTLSPSGSAKIFKTFNGKSLPPQSQIVRQSSLRKPPSSVHQQNRSVSGALGDNTNYANRIANEPTRPSYLRTSSSDFIPLTSGQVFEAYDRDMNKSTWREIKPLGKGAFSTVVLARPAERLVKPQYQHYCDKLVAVKLIDVDAARDSSAKERLSAGLKREIDILQGIHHPSLVRLYAFNADISRALLVLPYCAGGDLFELAANHRDQISVDLLRRIYAETVEAVAYLHSNYIVHRDIKLENILLNESITKMQAMSNDDVKRYDHPLVTLTDLGLSRRIDPEDPTLTTRCGSEDYVPPEIIMNQPYDGRETDAWALGVVLYALIENRLPFDPPPGSAGGNRVRRAAHRIARVEWKWYGMDDSSIEYADAKTIVEGCLTKRDVRWSVSDIQSSPWVDSMVPALHTDANDWIGEMFIDQR